MTLGELIEALEAADPNHVAPLGFGVPFSWRGNYADIAFEPQSNVTVGSMLEHARSALGKTFRGYKGGEFTMHEYTDCYIDRYGESGGDKIGPLLVAYMTGAVEDPNRGNHEPV